MFSAVTTKSSADAVFDQVVGEIVGGSLAPGSTLPGERELASQLAVSRSVVREALQRLSQSGLIEIRQGGATRVLDYQRATDLNLLSRLLINPDSTINVQVVRSILETRISIGSDAARLCASRATDGIGEQLGQFVDLIEATDDMTAKQEIDLEFWEAVVAGSGNIVYRLAYNGMAATYRPILDVITAVVEPELTDLRPHRRLVRAITRSDATGARRAALEILESSNAQWDDLLQAIELGED